MMAAGGGDRAESSGSQTMMAAAAGDRAESAGSQMMMAAAGGDRCRRDRYVFFICVSLHVPLIALFNVYGWFGL